MRWLRCLLVALAFAVCAQAHAVQVDEVLPDPVLEARARTLQELSELADVIVVGAGMGLWRRAQRARARHPRLPVGRGPAVAGTR